MSGQRRGGGACRRYANICEKSGTITSPAPRPSSSGQGLTRFREKYSSVCPPSRVHDECARSVCGGGDDDAWVGNKHHKSCARSRRRGQVIFGSGLENQMEPTIPCRRRTCCFRILFIACSCYTCTNNVTRPPTGRHVRETHPDGHRTFSARHV